MTYVAQLTGLISEQDEKLVTEAMVDREEIARFEVSREAHRVKFIATRQISDSELAELLSGTGAALLWLAAVQDDGTLSGTSYDANAFPVYSDTGDPAADNATYEAAKAAWLAAHPGWVDVNTRPIGSETMEAENEK